MKVNEIAKMSGMNIETIRMYRNMGFLHPTKLSNGYYDYSMQDFVSLSHVRKFREFDFSLDDIQKLEHEYDIPMLLEEFKTVEERINTEIQLLQEKIRFIHFERDHVLSSKNTRDTNVTVNQSVDEKIDLYPPFKQTVPLLPDDTPGFFLYTTTPIFISKDILNGEVEDKIIETKLGIGTYRSIIDKYNLTIPQEAIIVPNGLCISQTIRTKDLTHINIKDLSPMINYAKKLKQKFISDTTGYLVGIHYEDASPTYLMRIRACIEANDTISPDRL